MSVGTGLTTKVGSGVSVGVAVGAVTLVSCDDGCAALLIAAPMISTATTIRPTMSQGLRFLRGGLGGGGGGIVGRCCHCGGCGG